MSRGASAPSGLLDRLALGMWRRLPTTIALAGLIMAVGLYFAVWIIALSRGNVRAIAQHYDVPAEFRGSHGPWRHHGVFRELYGYASIVLVVSVLPFAGIGALVERTGRAGIVAGLALVMLIVNCAHFPLFD